MDGNKDEAVKCVRIGKKALDAGDRPRALKFLSMARRLDPALQIDDLISAATSQDDHPSPAPPDEPNSSPPPAADIKPPSDASSSSRTYTEEQVTVVRKIKNQKDYYQILGLERNCTVEDIRKAYRKFSLKVHPDKNKAPGAEEAFKAVSKAFQCLSNEESRKRYDLVGSEEPDSGGAAARRRHTAYNGFYEEDIDADEIFRSFFGGMAPAAAPFGTFRFRAGPAFHNTHPSDGFNIRTLIQILPVIILLLVNILPSLFPSSQPVYMLSRSYEYDYKVETSSGVPYYVKSAKFEEDYPHESQERISLEQNVERDFFGILRRNCQEELQRRQWGFSYQTPHCDMLKKYQDAAA